MAGTDRSRPAQAGPGPAIILIEPQLSENIGMAARAMLNCGLQELRLVRPREIWPNDKAVAAASGADRILDGARLFPSTQAAIADLSRVFAATARPRYMTKPVWTARQAAGELRGLIGAGIATGILFGREATGLDNDDIALADTLITIPLNPQFSSLNLAMAVLMVGYEWFQRESDAPGAVLTMPKETRPATRDELIGLFEHLESELDDCGFLRNLEKRPIMVRNLRNMFGRADLTEQEVRTLRGVITCLVSGRKGRPAG
jgi:tRNA/rRNA methyltransferase